MNPEDPMRSEDDSTVRMCYTRVTEVTGTGELDEKRINWPAALLHLAAASQKENPRSYKEEMRSIDKEKWIEALDKEVGALTENGTFETLTLPSGRKALGCKWVFTIKDNGTYKTRLVVLGNHQREGIDFQSTFSPVIRYTSLPVTLAIAAEYGLIVRQMDVTTAFLNGTLEEEIYMKQPEGYKITGQEDKV